MARMHVRPSAHGTKPYMVASVWCRRVPRRGDNADHARILLGTLRDMLRNDDDRIVRSTTEIARGVRRRASR